MKFIIFSNEEDKKEFNNIAEAARHFGIPKLQIHYAIQNNKNIITRRCDNKCFQNLKNSKVKVKLIFFYNVLN